MLLGTLFVISDARWALFFSYLGSSLWHFLWPWIFLGGACCTKWVPEPTFYDFGCLLGLIFGDIWGCGWALGGHLGAFWWHLGDLWRLFLGFMSEILKLWKVLFPNWALLKRVLTQLLNYRRSVCHSGTFSRTLSGFWRMLAGSGGSQWFQAQLSKNTMLFNDFKLKCWKTLCFSMISSSNVEKHNALSVFQIWSMHCCFCSVLSQAHTMECCYTPKLQCPSCSSESWRWVISHSLVAPWKGAGGWRII
jgi:hypothetical protein